MSDYNLYDFTIKEQNVMNTLKNAHGDGYEPMIIINGMYYTIKFEQEGK